MEMVSGSGSFTAAGIQPSQSARIEVIGVGGGGSNAVNRMIPVSYTHLTLPTNREV